MEVKYKCKFVPTGEVFERVLEVDTLQELHKKLNEWNKISHESGSEKKWIYWI